MMKKLTLLFVGLAGLAVLAGLLAARSSPEKVAEPTAAPVSAPTNAGAVPETLVANHHNTSLVPTHTNQVTMRVRGNEVALFPSDPLNPFASRIWYYPAPAHLVERKFDAPTRRLDGVLWLAPAEIELHAARKNLARLYQGNGHGHVEAGDLALVPLPMTGYSVALIFNNGQTVPLLKQAPSANKIINAVQIRFSYYVPESNPELHELLTYQPSNAAVQIETMHDFKRMRLNSATLELTESAAQKALESMVGKAVKQDETFCVDRDGLHRLKLLISQEVRVKGTGDEKATTRLLEMVDKKIDRVLKPMAPGELLALPSDTPVFSAKGLATDFRPEEFSKQTTASTSYLKDVKEKESIIKSLVDADIKKMDDCACFNHVKETQSRRGGASFLGIFGGSFDFSGSYDGLTKDEKKTLSAIRHLAKNETELREKVFTERNSTFHGDDKHAGVRPGSPNLYRVSASTIAARLIIGVDEGVTVGKETMTFCSLLPLVVFPVQAVAQVGDQKKSDETLDHLLRQFREHRQEVDKKLKKQAEELAKLSAEVKKPLPVLAAGFVNPDGTLAYSGGAQVSVQTNEIGKKPDDIEYVVYFKELQKIPVVIATGYGRGYNVSVISVKKDHFRVYAHYWSNSAYGRAGFNFVVVEVP